MISEKRAVAFLNEYEDLCRKHGLSLHGCGCCGSPWMHELNRDDILMYNKENGYCQYIIFAPASNIENGYYEDDMIAHTRVAPDRAELDAAMKRFTDALLDSLYIYQFMDWCERKLKGTWFDKDRKAGE